MKSRTLSVLAATSLLALAAGCGGSKEAPSEASKAPEGAVWKPAGNEGSITGKISFQGQPPKLRPIAMDADAVCAAKHSGPVYPETVVVNDNGTLRYVFVHIKSGLEGKNFAVPDQPAVIDQDGCVYKPHVLGLQARQQLRVVTSDKTTHNIHPLPKINREWNVSQPPGADPIIQTFSRPETTIPVKCNQHPWMRANLHVTNDPFFAVSGNDGAYKIAGVPPGDYELETIHEEYGAQTQKVTVPPSGTATADFTYKPSQAYKPSSFKTLPAIVLGCCKD